MTTILGVLILICAVFLIGSVLLQSSKNHRMSGVVSGGADTFFGKQKGKTIDAALSKATAVISVIFCGLILALYIYTAKTTNAPEAPVTTDTDTEAADLLGDINNGGAASGETNTASGENEAGVPGENETEVPGENETEVPGENETEVPGENDAEVPGENDAEVPENDVANPTEEGAEVIPEEVPNDAQ